MFPSTKVVLNTLMLKTLVLLNESGWRKRMEARTQCVSRRNHSCIMCIFSATCECVIFFLNGAELKMAISKAKLKLMHR